MVRAYKIEKIITAKEGVTVSVTGKTVSVKGPKGSLQRTFRAPGISIEQKDNTISVSARDAGKKGKAFVGTVASHIQNMVAGVASGYLYKMKVFYTHFPITVSVKDKEIVINNFLGEKHPRRSRIVGDTKVDVKGQDITITGINKEEVGQTSANLVIKTRIGRRDPRVFKDGIFLVEKGVNE